MNRVFVVDGNWYIHRVYFALQGKSQKLESSLPYAFLRLIAKDGLSVRATHLLVAFDGDSVFRYKVYSKYKASRNEGKEIKDQLGKDVYEYLPNLLRYLENVGVPFIQMKKYEADDVLASVAAYLGGNNTVILGTRDKDQHQVLGPNVSQYVSIGKTPFYIREKDVLTKYKLKSCKQFVDYQTIIGDSIDGIHGVKGMTPMKAAKLLQTHKSLKRFLKTPQGKEWIPHLELLRRNRKLVKLVDDCYQPELDELKLTRPKNSKNLPSTYLDLISLQSRRTLF